MMISKPFKMLKCGGVHANPVNSIKKSKVYECDKGQDIRVINYCLYSCPHQKCTGNRCKELIDYQLSLKEN